VSDRDLDAEFARIIAGWDDEAPDPQARPTSPADGDAARAAHSPGADAPGPDDAAPGADRQDPLAGEVLSSDVLGDGFRADGAGQPPPATAPASEAEPNEPTRPARPSADDAAPPASPPAPSPQSGGSALGLPIAPTTSHVWRGSPPQRDDVDDLLDAVDPEDDHFVPPSQIDLPSAESDPMFWAIVGGLVGGPLLLLYVLFFDREGSGWWVVTALAMIVVGFVLLVLRGGTERDPFDDGTRL
jgi:hypothetical protein